MGRPHVLLITLRIVHALRVAKQCIAVMPPAGLVGDKCYCRNDLRLTRRTRYPGVIPSKRNRRVQHPFEPAIYKQRNFIDRMFCRFRVWRRVAARFDREVKNLMATIAISATVIWWLA